MITPTDITQHVKTYLPIWTDKFTKLLTVSSASIASNIITVNATAHGKSAGNPIVITGGTVRNTIAASVDDDPEIGFTTDYDHDQTVPSQANDTWELTLAGFSAPDTAWNDEHTIVGVPNRRTFIVPGSSEPTTVVGAYLVEKLATGSYTIATAGTNSFTLDFTAYPPLPDGVIDGFTAISGFRISAVADFDRAKAIYTKQTNAEAYCFIIMTDGDASKDRHTQNDGQAGFLPQDMHLIRVFRNFSTVVFLPTGSDLSGVAAQDLAYGSIYSALIATIFGFADFDQVIAYSAVPVGDGPGEYNSAYYAHVYDWQLPTTLTFEDGFIKLDDVAFRDIEQTFKMFNYPETDAAVTANINLDEEPV